MQAMQEIRLEVGESIFLKKGLVTQVRLLYAGMVNPTHFSMVVHVVSSGNNSHAYNLYWPKTMRSLRVRDREINVVDVSPEAIRMLLT